MGKPIYNNKDIQDPWRLIMANVTFNEDLCKGCGLCVHACPKKILQLDKERLNTKGYHPVSCTDTNECIGCTQPDRMAQGARQR